jgi:hypothetical protein
MVLDLPNTYHSRQATHKRLRSWWLLIYRNGSLIVCLIANEHNKNQIQATHGENQPKYSTPVSGTSDDEIGEERTKVWRKDEDSHPYTNLPRVFVEVEHILNASESHDLVCGERQTHHGSKTIEDWETGCDSAGKSEERPCESGPKHDGRATPVRGHDDPNEATNTADEISRYRNIAFLRLTA